MSETNTVSPLRQRMIEDMTARKLDPHTQRSHIYSCKRFTAWLNVRPTQRPPKSPPLPATPRRDRRQHRTATGS